MKKTVLGALCFILSGCVAHSGPPVPVDRLTCAKDVCPVMWRAAQAWVAQRSVFPMQVVSDAVIQTQRPRGVEAYYAYEVIRRPLSQMEDEIQLTLICMNLFGCGLSRNELDADFKRALRAAAG